ncbi:MAG: DEAD/DEAH box helicase [Candidatus Omnitrophica bacterium]|nr:DEAD/DEAH box helicase [Candidatus Omnitrophota bacterium]
MEINALENFSIPEFFIEKFKKENIFRFYPPQEEAIRKGLLDKEENFLLAFPTASGKTLLASLLAIKTLIQKLGKVVYIVPLVALANEKYLYYKNFFSNFKVALSVGDMDSSEPWLANYDFIVVTTEKLDSLIRHGMDWISQIKLIIVDEVHLLNDTSRGPTLEIVIAQLRRLSPQARILALSATVSNSEEISQWLNAELIKSDFRPVKLYEGILSNSLINFVEKEGYFLNAEISAEEAITEHTLKMKKQILFFVASRRNAESLAERLGKVISSFLSLQEKEFLQKLGKEVLSILETPTHQCRRLAKCIKEGAAFHHAGLLSRQRKIIEDGFRQGYLKVVVATPTLALGVNLPCFRVVVRDVKRYYPGLGSEYIPTMEYKQFIGRAGRPQYDEFGEAILISRSEREKEELMRRYIFGEPEEINSKLAQEEVLRMHLLSLISGGFCRCLGDLEEFFKLTFFGFQYQDMRLLRGKVETVLRDLLDWGFIVSEDKFYKATQLGRRISQLYLDPHTGYEFINALKKMTKRKEISELAILLVISLSREMSPPLMLSEDDFYNLSEFLNKKDILFVNEPPSMWEDNYEEFLSALKLALVFEAWINEEDEEAILDKFRLTPGEFHAKREIGDWLIYSLEELSKILKLNIQELRKLRIRLHYGVREELLGLVNLREIGRKRARRLFKAGFKNISLLRKAEEKAIARIVGPSIAHLIKEQIFLPSGDKK